MCLLSKKIYHSVIEMSFTFYGMHMENIQFQNKHNVGECVQRFYLVPYKGVKRINFRTYMRGPSPNVRNVRTTLDMLYTNTYPNKIICRNPPEWQVAKLHTAPRYCVAEIMFKMSVSNIDVLDHETIHALFHPLHALNI